VTLHELAKSTYESGKITKPEWESTYKAYCLSERQWAEKGLGETYTRAIIWLHRQKVPGSQEWRVSRILKALKMQPKSRVRAFSVACERISPEVSIAWMTSAGAARAEAYRNIKEANYQGIGFQDIRVVRSPEHDHYADLLKGRSISVEWIQAIYDHEKTFD
jgi:hypothetical protein